MVTSSSPRHPAGVEIVAVYVVVSDGLAVVVPDVGEPNPAVGLQITSLPPVASNSTTSPLHIVMSGEISVCSTSTTTVTEAVPTPHALLSSTV